MASSLAVPDDDDGRVAARSDHPAPPDVEGEGGTTMEEGYGRWRGGSDDDDCDDISSGGIDEDPSISSEDGGVEAFLRDMLKRGGANDDGAKPPPTKDGCKGARAATGEGGMMERPPSQGAIPSPNSDYRWGNAIAAVPRLSPKYVDPDPVDYSDRLAPYNNGSQQRPRSPTATEYYSAMHPCNGSNAIHDRSHPREQGKVFDLDEWEAARAGAIGGANEAARDRQRHPWQLLRATNRPTEGMHTKGYPPPPHAKIRDALDVKEKRANEVLAALERAKRSSDSAPILATVALDAGSEDRAPFPSTVAGSSTE